MVRIEPDEGSHSFFPLAPLLTPLNTANVTAPFNRESSLGWLINVLATNMALDLNAKLKTKGLSLKVWPTLMCLWEQEGLTERRAVRDVATVTFREGSYATQKPGTVSFLKRCGLVMALSGYAAMRFLNSGFSNAARKAAALSQMA